MHLKKRLMCFISCFILMSTVTVNAADEVSPNTDAQLQKILDDTRQQYNFSAMGLTVIDPSLNKDPINLFSGTTEKSNDRKVEKTDMFQIGSNTKSFIAALLLKLQGEKKLSLDDPITKYLPQYKKWSKVKIRNLLHNNSGVPSYTEDKKFLKIMDDDLHKQFSSTDLMNYVIAKPLMFQPGKRWYYSNSNWILAGMIAEKVTNESIGTLLQKYFFTPLNLSNTKFVSGMYDNETKQHLVHGYSDKGADMLERNMSWANSAGAIIATNEDLAHWTYALFHGKVLTQNELAQMQQIVSTTNGRPISNPKKEGYGLGVGVRINKAGTYWGHEGHTEAFHSIFSYFPKEDITIAMTSSGIRDADFHKILIKLMDVLRNAKKAS